MTKIMQELIERWEAISLDEVDIPDHTTMFELLGKYPELKTQQVGIALCSYCSGVDKVAHSFLTETLWSEFVFHAPSGEDMFGIVNFSCGGFRRLIELCERLAGKRYYIYCQNHKKVRGFPVWLKPNYESKGKSKIYTYDLDEAGRYTRKEADKIERYSKGKKVPYPCALLDKVSCRSYIPNHRAESMAQKENEVLRTRLKGLVKTIVKQLSLNVEFHNYIKSIEYGLREGELEPDHVVVPVSTE